MKSQLIYLCIVNKIIEIDILNPHIHCYWSLHILSTNKKIQIQKDEHQLGSLVVRAFASCLEGPGSIPGRVKLKISNW